MKNEKRLARIITLKKRQEDLRRADVAGSAARVREVEEVLGERRRHEEMLHASIASTRDVDARDLQASAALLAEHRRSLVAVTEALRARREEHEAKTVALSDVARGRYALERRQRELRDARLERDERVEQEALDDSARRGGRR
jgi:hypothetical protein